MSVSIIDLYSTQSQKAVVCKCDACVSTLSVSQENIMSRLSSKPSPSLPADVNDADTVNSVLTVSISLLML